MHAPRSVISRTFSLYPCVPVSYHFVLLELSLTSTPLPLIFSLRGALDLALGPGRRKREEAGGRRRVRTGAQQRGRSGPGDAFGHRASRPGAAGAGGAPPPSTAARPDRRPAAREEWAGRRLRPLRVQARGRRRGWGAAGACRASRPAGTGAGEAGRGTPPAAARLGRGRRCAAAWVGARPGPAWGRRGAGPACAGSTASASA